MRRKILNYLNLFIGLSFIENDIGNSEKHQMQIIYNSTTSRIIVKDKFNKVLLYRNAIVIFCFEIRFCNFC